MANPCKRLSAQAAGVAVLLYLQPHSPQAPGRRSIHSRSRKCICAQNIMKDDAADLAKRCSWCAQSLDLTHGSPPRGVATDNLPNDEQDACRLRRGLYGRVQLRGAENTTTLVRRRSSRPLTGCVLARHGLPAPSTSRKGVLYNAATLTFWGWRRKPTTSPWTKHSRRGIVGHPTRSSPRPDVRLARGQASPCS